MPTETKTPRRSAAHTLHCWVEAMRLRTLPVSVSGVITAIALVAASTEVMWLPAGICLAFAILAQIASNFANEYFDFRKGLDRPGREGPRRGVTEGDITPRAMLCATLITLAIACALGCTLIYWGGWWLIAAGVAIAAGVFAYSAGPYPLSHHGLGEVAVVVFFGIAPVTLTYYVLTLTCPFSVWIAATAVGLMGANVLVINNYRDHDDDKAVGKRTLAVRFGEGLMLWLYPLNFLAAGLMMLGWWHTILHSFWSYLIAYVLCAAALTLNMREAYGHKLNPMLGKTSIFMLVCALVLLLNALIFH